MTGLAADCTPVLEDGLLHEPGREQVLDQLGRITGSSLFRNSKRYPSLLRYIVDEALEGRGDSLKERTLGVCVFGRGHDYDTNADPVVRISAGEVRKRIAQYYQAPGHQHELRIEIPLGSYVPRFFWPVEDAPRAPHLANQGTTEPTSEPHLTTLVGPIAPAPAPAPLLASPPKSRRTHLHLALLYTLLFAGALAWGLTAWHAFTQHRLPPATARFWNHFLRPQGATLIVIGVHSFDPQGNDISYRTHASLPQTDATLLSTMTRADMIQLSDLTSYAALTTLLTRRNHAFRTQGAADTTLEQLREGPFILIGGFNKLWTTRLSTQLRYRFVTLNGSVNVIQDGQHPEHTWTLDSSQSALSNTRDYALVSCYLDPVTDQYVMIVAGIGRSGTEAASDFVTNDAELSAWLHNVSPRPGENLQVVLSTDVIEGKHGPPHVVESYRW